MPSLKPTQLAFFSYAHEDAEFALRLAKDLRAGAAAVWMDRLDIKPGQRWDRAIEDALAKCPQLLVILSPAAIESTNVMDEVSLALEEGKTVLPVIHRECKIPFRLRRLQYVDLTQNYDEGVVRLLETLRFTTPSSEAPKDVLHQEIGDSSDHDGGAKEVNLLSQPVPQKQEATLPTPKRAVFRPATTIIWGVAILLIALTSLLLILNQTGIFKQTVNKPTPPPETVIFQKSSAAPPQPRATESELAQTVGTPAETPSSQSKFTGYDPAIATVDMQRIFNEYEKTKTAKVKINDAKNAAKKEYDNRAEAYKKALDEINNLNRQLNDNRLSAEERNEKAKERDSNVANLKNMEQEISDFRQSTERQLQEQLMRMREGIVKEITDKVRELGGVADIIFDRSGISITGVPVLMYSLDRGNMSDKVIGALNNGSPSRFTTIRNRKIALIDMQRAFKNYNKTKEAEVKINDAKNAAKKEYDNRAEAYKKALDEINNLNSQLNGYGLSAEERTQKAKERDSKVANLKKMEQENKSFRQTTERQLQEQLMRMREGIVKEITDVMMNAAKTNNIDVVLDISGMSTKGVPIIIYRHGIPDFTDEVVATLNGTRSSGNLLASSPSSRTLRFGVVDMHRAFEAWPEMKATEAKINDEKAAAKNNYARQSPTEHESRDKQIEAIKLKERIVAEIEATVNTCAERAGFNLVFDSSGYSINGVPVVVFARDLPDLTDAVVKEHDLSH
jgi:Skp family chaperone for outer membrane proteins